jgi:hypothetical protein
LENVGLCFGRSGALFVFEGFTTEDTESTEETKGEESETT